MAILSKSCFAGTYTIRTSERDNPISTWSTHRTPQEGSAGALHRAHNTLARVLQVLVHACSHLAIALSAAVAGEGRAYTDVVYHHSRFIALVAPIQGVSSICLDETQGLL